MSVLFGLGTTFLVLKATGKFTAVAMAAVSRPFLTAHDPHYARHHAALKDLRRLDEMNDVDLADIGLRRGDLDFARDLDDPTSELGALIEKRRGNNFQ